MINYCLPIQLPTKKQVLQRIDEHQGVYQFFEVWVDYIEDLDDAFIGHLVDLYADALVVVFHRKPGMPTRIATERKRALLRDLAGSKSILDLDLRAEREDLAYIQAEQLSITTIVSFHDYEGTPPSEELSAAIAAMAAARASIFKFSTFCNSEADAVRLLQLQMELKAQGRRHIVLGMGPHGAVTRIFGSMWGNAMIFAPRSEAERSAPGQLTQQQLTEIFKLLPR